MTQTKSARKLMSAKEVSRQKVNDYVANEIFCYEQLHGPISEAARESWEAYRVRELARIDARS